MFTVYAELGQCPSCSLTGYLRVFPVEFSQQSPLYSHIVSAAQKLLLCFVVVAYLPLAWASDTGAFKSVVWTPQQLESGSVCLFTVDLAGATSLHGKWMDHDLFFAKSKGKNIWYSAAGVDVEAKPGIYPLRLEARLPSGENLALVREVRVAAAPYKTEKIHVPTRFVEPDEATRKIIESDKAIKQQVFDRVTAAPEWSGNFRPPVPNTVSETFGTRRTFNGKLASIHRGVDYHAAPGTPVLASNAGEVVLARPLFYEGNCVVIDHGQGLMTIYMHLSKLQVAEGDKVLKGAEIGLSGATGRVTGPHLHMAVRWESAYVDPLKLLKLPLPVME